MPIARRRRGRRRARASPRAAPGPRARAEYDSLRIPEGPTSVMRGLAKVRRSGVGVEVRPKLLDHPVARQSVAVGESEQRNQFPRPSRGPVALCNLAAGNHDAEAPQHLDAHVGGGGRHDVHLCGLPTVPGRRARAAGLPQPFSPVISPGCGRPDVTRRKPPFRTAAEWLLAVPRPRLTSQGWEHPTVLSWRGGG